MGASSPLTCSCGVRAFRDIRFHAHGILYVTCFGCGVTNSVNLSALAEAPELPKVEPAPEPARTGYKYPAMF